MFYTSSLYSKTSFPGADTFSSTVHLSMGGAGYLKPSSSNFNVNPSIFGGKIFSASIIKYPASIASQNIGITLPIINNGFSSFSINHISYGTFDGYTEDFEPTGSYSSSDTRISGSYGRTFSKIPLRIGIRSNYYLLKYGDQRFRMLSLGIGLAINSKKPFIPINHLEGHIISTSFNNVISSDVKNSLLLLSKLKVASEETISILPRYLPKFVSIPINDKRSYLVIVQQVGVVIVMHQFPPFAQE